jgi:hypothetical protein
MTLEPEELFAPYSEPDTSRDAAHALAPHVSRLELLTWEAIVNAGPHGLTDAELETATRLGPNTARPRRVGLVLKGLVIHSGNYRRTPSGRMAKVWTAACVRLEKGGAR